MGRCTITKQVFQCHQMMIKIAAVVFIIILNQLSLAVGQSSSTPGSQGDGSVPGNTTASPNATNEGKGDKSTANTGAVVAAVVIAVVACIAIVVIVYFVKMRRQSRMMDKEKKMQIQMTSARNAGVYQDLTVSVPPDEKPPASPEHERLKNAEDV